MEICTKEIPLFKSVFCGDVDREFEKETSLADYCSGILRLIKLDATPYVESAVINGDKCIVSGTYLFSMLYESSESTSLSFTTFALPFSERTEIKTGVKDGTVNCKVKVKRIGCKIINPRKFSVRVKSIFCISVQGIEKAKICDTSLLPDNVHVKKDTIVYKEKTDEKSSEFTFEESYTLSEKTAPVDDVITNYMSTEKTECFVSGGKAEIKATVTSKLMYTAEGAQDKCVLSKKSFPVSMTFDDTEFDDDIILCCDTSVVSAETSVDLDSYGENRVIQIKFTVRCNISLYKTCETEFASDAFASESKNYPVMQKFTTLTDRDTVSKIFSLENRFSSDAKITEIADHTCKINECKLKSEENGYALYGSYTVSLLCRIDDRYENVDMTESFEEKIADIDPNFDLCDIDCRVLETNVSALSEESEEVKTVFGLTLTPKAYRTFSAVTDIVVLEEGEKDSFNLIYCFPSSKDDLWNIAKRYFTDPEALRTDNPEIFNSTGELTCRLPIIIKK